MRQLFDFVCPSCEMICEKLVESDQREISCQCGDMATRMIGMPSVRLDGTDPGFPGAYSKWADIREANARIKGKRSYAG